jgi:hypothetical protein
MCTIFQEPLKRRGKMGDLGVCKYNITTDHTYKGCEDMKLTEMAQDQGPSEEFCDYGD